MEIRNVRIEFADNRIHTNRCRLEIPTLLPSTVMTISCPFSIVNVVSGCVGTVSLPSITWYCRNAGSGIASSKLIYRIDRELASNGFERCKTHSVTSMHLLFFECIFLGKKQSKGAILVSQHRLHILVQNAKYRKYAATKIIKGYATHIFQIAKGSLWATRSADRSPRDHIYSKPGWEKPVNNSHRSQ